MDNLSIVSPNETELERILGEELNMTADSNVEEYKYIYINKIFNKCNTWESIYKISKFNNIIKIRFKWKYVSNKII